MSEKDSSDDDDDSSSASESSSDDEHQWKQSVKDQYKKIQMEKRANKRTAESSLKPKTSSASSNNLPASKQPKFFEIKDGMEYFKSSSNTAKSVIQGEKMKKLPLSSRIQYQEQQQASGGGGGGSKDTTMVFRSDSFGNKQMTFVSRREKREKDAEKRALEHHNERKGIRRSAGRIVKTLQKPNFFSKKSK